MAGSSAADTHRSLLAGRLPILRQSDRLECELILIFYILVVTNTVI